MANGKEKKKYLKTVLRISSQLMHISSAGYLETELNPVMILWLERRDVLILGGKLEEFVKTAVLLLNNTALWVCFWYVLNIFI